MALKIVVGFLGLLIVFLGYVSTREGKFRYERSGLIQAAPETIFPYISQLKMGGQWSPYEKRDPNMKKTYTGEDGKPGAAMEFEGNPDSGSGKIEILKLVPNELVEFKLTMLKPIHAENSVEYKLSREGQGTRFSWIMSGDGGFLGKLINVFIDCEKMVAGDFEVGIANLKSLVETGK